MDNTSTESTPQADGNIDQLLARINGLAGGEQAAGNPAAAAPTSSLLSEEPTANEDADGNFFPREPKTLQHLSLIHI